MPLPETDVREVREDGEEPYQIWFCDHREATCPLVHQGTTRRSFRWVGTVMSVHWLGLTLTGKLVKITTDTEPYVYHLEGLK